MTVNYHFPESGGTGRGRHLRPETSAGRRGTSAFCDLHLFHHHGQPPRIVIVHYEPSHGAPAVTWLEVRSAGDTSTAAAVLMEVLGRAAAEAQTPVRLYDHDVHGNIHSWLPHRPTELTRERLASSTTQAGRPQR